MARLFDRRVKVILAVPSTEDYHTISGNIHEITDLRVQFKVEKNLSKEPNTAEISITNLSPRSRAEFQRKGVKVMLQAGYADTLATIYVGDVRDTENRREGPDWTTKIQSGDSERAFRHARVNESVKGGVKVPDLIRKLGDAAGLGIGNLEKQANLALAGRTVQHGYAVHGTASRELDRLLKAYNLEWSIQDGQLQILAFGQGTDEPVVAISPETGMIGSPEMSAPEKPAKPGSQSTAAARGRVLKVKTLIQAINPGRRVVVKSLDHNGIMVAKKVSHSGDTTGGDWYTELELAETS